MHPTIQEILTQIYRNIVQQSDTPMLDAQVLLSHYLDKPRSWVVAHPESQITDKQYDLILQGMDRLKLGEPLPYVVGHWEFYGQDFDLTHDVLIPRPETEILVERAITWLNKHPNQRVVIDVGTGSGCIGISLALNIPDLHVLMTDISPEALIVTRQNSEKYNLSDRLEFQPVDLLEGVPGNFDLICANLPYIPSQVLENLPVSKKEPWLALDGGFDGLEQITRLLDQARDHLAPGGIILLEIECSQANALKTLAGTYFPACEVEIYTDLAGLDRCVEITPKYLLFHICPGEEWQLAKESGIYKDLSLLQEGFIHCSTPQQILQVANRFYQGIPGLVLLWIDPIKIKSEIRWEVADGTQFPHVYGPINLEAVLLVTHLKPDEDGTFRTVEIKS